MDDRVARGDGPPGGRPVPAGPDGSGTQRRTPTTGRPLAVARARVPRRSGGPARDLERTWALSALMCAMPWASRGGRAAPVRPGCAVDGGGLSEASTCTSLPSASTRSWARRSAGPGFRRGRPAAGAAGAREDGDAGEPAGAEGPAPPASEDAPGRRTGDADGRGELAATPHGAWLADGGLRIGELCGLHLVDLHLRQDAACGECRWPHVHVCHRPGNPNGAEAKTKHPWRPEGGTVTGGLVKRVSPAMVHAYFEYLTCLPKCCSWCVPGVCFRTSLLR